MNIAVLAVKKEGKKKRPALPRMMTGPEEVVVLRWFVP